MIIARQFVAIIPKVVAQFLGKILEPDRHP